MGIEIRFNKKLGKWEGILDGEVVTRSKNENSVKRRMAKKSNEELFATDEAIEQADTVPSEFSVDERFEFLEHFVKMVARGQSNSLFVSGPGGLGKTHTVLETLKKCGKKEETLGDFEGDFITIKGYTTAKAMYRTLWENNGKIVIFDDADSSYKDVVGMNILKAALDSYDRRIVTWGAEGRGDDDLPSRFEFTGRVIFISNMSMERVPQALVSRSLKVSLDMNCEEKVSRIETVIKQKEFMPNVDKEIKVEVMNFIRENAKKFTDLNIRSAMNLVKIRNSMDSDEAKMFDKIALYNAIA